MRLPKSAPFTGLQQAVKGVDIGPQDAQPFILPVINPTIQIPAPLEPTPTIPTGTAYQSWYIWNFQTHAPSTGSLAVTVRALSAGLWRLSGRLTTISDINSGNSRTDRIAIQSGNIRHAIALNMRRVTPLSCDFNIWVLLREDSDLDYDSSQTDNAETVDSHLLISAEKYV